MLTCGRFWWVHHLPVPKTCVPKVSPRWWLHLLCDASVVAADVGEGRVGARAAVRQIIRTAASSSEDSIERPSRASPHYYACIRDLLKTLSAHDDRLGSQEGAKRGRLRAEAKVRWSAGFVARRLTRGDDRALQHLKAGSSEEAPLCQRGRWGLCVHHRHGDVSKR